MKTLLAICVALLVAMIGVGGWVLSRPNPMQGVVARLEGELKTAQGEIARLKSELETRRKKSAVSLPPLPASAAKGSAAAGGAAAGAGPGKDATVTGGGKRPGMMSAMRQMLDAPGMKEMMKQQSLVQIDMLYSRLFEEFQLNPEERENFRQLLAARTAAQSEMGIKMMAEETTPEQRQKITADYEAARKTSDEAIKTFLGHEDDFKRFQSWEDSAPERMQFEMMGGRSHFSAVGEPLTPQQEQQLIDTMVAARKAPSDLPDLNKPENLNPGNLTDDMIARQLQKYDQSTQAVAQQAAAFLSPAQLEGLTKFQQQMRSMAEAGLKMSSTMMKGKE